MNTVANQVNQSLADATTRAIQQLELQISGVTFKIGVAIEAAKMHERHGNPALRDAEFAQVDEYKKQLRSYNRQIGDIAKEHLARLQAIAA